MITLGQLEDMFAGMRAEAPFDVDELLLWGYFFTDPEKGKLEPLAEELAKCGFHVVNLYPTDDGETFFLHVEMVERHTPQSLNDRNEHFYALADKFGVESYDGMDVGPVVDKRE